MEKYNFNNEYKICVNNDGGIFDYYLEKKGYGDLFFMFGIDKKINPLEFTNKYINSYINDAKKRNFWKE